MKKRLRKKKRIKEFAIYGVRITCNAYITSDEEDELIDFIESLGLDMFWFIPCAFYVFNEKRSITDKEIDDIVTYLLNKYGSPVDSKKIML